MAVPKMVILVHLLIIVSSCTIRERTYSSEFHLRLNTDPGDTSTIIIRDVTTGINYDVSDKDYVEFASPKVVHTYRMDALGFVVEPILFVSTLGIFHVISVAKGQPFLQCHHYSTRPTPPREGAIPFKHSAVFIIQAELQNGGEVLKAEKIMSAGEISRNSREWEWVTEDISRDEFVHKTLGSLEVDLYDSSSFALQQAANRRWMQLIAVPWLNDENFPSSIYANPSHSQYPAPDEWEWRLAMLRDDHNFNQKQRQELQRMQLELQRLENQNRQEMTNLLGTTLGAVETLATDYNQFQQLRDGDTSAFVPNPSGGVPYGGPGGAVTAPTGTNCSDPQIRAEILKMLEYAKIERQNAAKFGNDGRGPNRYEGQGGAHIQMAEAYEQAAHAKEAECW